MSRNTSCATKRQHKAPRSGLTPRFRLRSWLLAACAGLFICGLVFSLPNNTNNPPQKLGIFTPVPNDGPVNQTSAQKTPENNETESNTSAQQLSQPLENNASNQALTTRADNTFNWKKINVKSGDTLSVIFNRLGLPSKDLQGVLESGKNTRSLTRLKPGQTLELGLDSNNQLTTLMLEESPFLTHIINKDDKGSYQYKGRKYLPEINTHFTQINIKNSLFYDASKVGLSDRTIMQLANLFEWEVDLSQELRVGDQFNVVYETESLDGAPVGKPVIIAAEYISKKNTFQVVRYTDKNGRSDYYTAEGKTLRQAFLRSPIEFARISSHFNMRRKHPVLHKIRAHKGTDYAARRGTPIRAAGAGKIIHAGRKGGYGNVVIIQHDEAKYKTLYAHMNSFGRGIRVGKRVKQGQVIGTVGSTGLATGPHLHYEFHVNNVPRNPVTVKLPNGVPVAASERQRFKLTAEASLAKLDQYRNTYFAKTEATSSSNAL